MRIFIMRHGDAPFVGGERKLSPLGHKEVALSASWLASRVSQLKVLSSPLTRAQETAAIVSESLGLGNQFELENLLKSETDPQVACQYFESLACPELLLATHMPFVVNLLEAWLPGQGRYFPTAAIAELQWSQPAEASNYTTMDRPQLIDFVSPSDLS